MTLSTDYLIASGIQYGNLSLKEKQMEKKFDLHAIDVFHGDLTMR